MAVKAAVGDGAVVTMDREIAQLVKHAESQGWTVTNTRNRLRFCSPLPGSPPVFVPLRFPGGKDLKSVMAMLHRAGLEDFPEGDVRYQDPETVEPAQTEKSKLDEFMLVMRAGIVDLLATAEEAQQWQQLAEDAERRTSQLEVELEAAIARAEKAEGRLAVLRDALAGE